MNKPLKLGLIGCGVIVQNAHLPGLLEIPGLVEVAAVADPFETNRNLVGDAAEVDASQRYADYRDMLASADLDVVSIATPHHLHYEQVVAAAQAGVAIISEKPMATSLEEADAILEAAKNVPYAVVHNFLFSPATQAARDILATGDFGTPIFGRSQSMIFKSGNQTADNWRNQKAAGGGAINDTCYHEIYLVEEMVGSPVRYVEARVQTKYFDLDIDDLVVLLLEHENGVTSTVATAWCIPAQESVFCEVHTPVGALHVVARGRALRRYLRAERQWEEVDLPAMANMTPEAVGRAGHAGYFAATMKALADGTDLPVPGAKARHNLAIIAAARRATEERRAIEVE
ncbi:MAG: hypothetical protein CL610_30070 [Anaerolineaceae bacterium]|nr:hypothetical protein [Anaerolineaceae bacterium]